jgi:ElaB/YqjD/DUF883 family membrane-anchored ribosome-binding protein
VSSSRTDDAAEASLKEQIDALRSELGRLTDVVPDLAKTAAERAVSALQDSTADIADTAVKRGRQAADEVSRRVEPVAGELVAIIERNPVSAVLVAASLGLVIGLMTRKGE